jgi:hypothetical protein
VLNFGVRFLLVCYICFGNRRDDEVDLNGLEIVCDATAPNELSVIESVVRSHQQRLTALQKAREELRTVDNVDDTEGIKYLALEREEILEQILHKLS